VAHTERRFEFVTSGPPLLYVGLFLTLLI